MSQVLTAVAPEIAPEPNAHLSEHQHAEQLLIEEARRRQRRRQRVIAAVVSSIVAAAGVAWAVAAVRRVRDRVRSPDSRLACDISDLLASHLHVSLSGEPTARRNDLLHREALEQRSRVHRRARGGARIRRHDLGYVGPWSSVFITNQTKTVVTTGQAAYVPLGIGQSVNWP